MQGKGAVGSRSSAEFGPFLAIYDALVARFGVAADERFAVVLKGITKARRQRYNAASRTRPRTKEEGEGGGRRQGGVHEEVSGCSADGTMTPAQEAKAEFYKELGYRTAGMVVVNLLAACRTKGRTGHIIRVIAPDGTTSDTLLRDAGGSARRA